MTSTMTRPRGPFTVADYLRLPEGAPYVLVGGHLLMSPSPTLRHQKIIMRIAFALLPAAESRGGVVLSDLDTGLEEDTIVRPDVLVLLDEAARSNDPFQRRPALAVEILSPGNEDYDRGLKWEACRRARLPEVWLVDAERRSVTVQRPDRPDEEVRGRAAPGFAPELTLDLARLLAD
jgi:Uma2 family endonuclease